MLVVMVCGCVCGVCVGGGSGGGGGGVSGTFMLSGGIFTCPPAAVRSSPAAAPHVWK